MLSLILVAVAACCLWLLIPALSSTASGTAMSSAVGPATGFAIFGLGALFFAPLLAIVVFTLVAVARWALTKHRSGSRSV